MQERPASMRATEDEDWATASQSPLMRRAALSVLSLGLFTFLLGLQLAWWGNEGLTPRTLLMFSFGAAALVLGRRMHLELDAQKTLIAAAFGGVTFVASLIWLMLLFLDGVISLLSAAVTVHAAITTVVCRGVLQPARAADAARRRLRARGYEV